MKQFQKIAIGLLGLTHPETLVLRWNAHATSRAKIDPSGKPGSIERLRPPDGRGARAMRAFKFMITALALGSRTVPLADNSRLRDELRDSAKLLYGSSGEP